MLVLLNMTMEPSNLREKNKGTTICNKRTIKCDVGTSHYDHRTVKCGKKNKGTTKCDKRIVKCDVGTAQCEDRIVKYNKKKKVRNHQM